MLRLVCRTRPCAGAWSCGIRLSLAPGTFTVHQRQCTQASQSGSRAAGSATGASSPVLSEPGPWDALVAAGYFGLLELAPVLLVLYYYRRIPRPRRPDEHAALFPLKGAGRDARDALRRLAELQFEPFEPAESVV